MEILASKRENLLNKAETFQIGLQGLIEGQAGPISPDLVYRSQEISSNASLTFPTFLVLLISQGKLFMIKLKALLQLDTRTL